MRRALALLVLLAVAVVGLGGCTKEEADVVGSVNHLRTERGLAPLEWREDMYDHARGWAEEMARTRTLSHSRLSIEAMPGDIVMVTENVGSGGSPQAVVDGFMRSAVHREKMLKADYRYTAVGVVWGGDRWWVAQLYAK